MLLVREVQALAGDLSQEDFQKQVGPFVLVRRPPDPKVARKALSMGNQRTRLSRTPAQSKIVMAELLQQFDDLEVATLPPIHGSEEMQVGRLPDNDLVIEDPSVSKRHAVLRWSRVARQCTVTDLGSRNGTLLNTDFIRDVNTPLKDGDMLTFGDAEFCFLETPSLLAMLRVATTH
ncbi:FHA domain-containing protein [Hyalangium gracile]|uniref:FHA domain-containing protein n=1 Tax=Hyalangium gracile TaxID=394092 RepID=UPI001CC97FDF|nr:FHA domain-containing protein [Hyalangium gracile]